MELSYLADEDAGWPSLFENQFGSFFWRCQAAPLRALYARDIKHMLIQRPVHEYTWKLYLKQPQTGNNPNLHLLVNGETDCPISVLWNTIKQEKEQNSDIVTWIYSGALLQRERRQTRPHSVWFHLYDILEKTKL